MGGSTGQYESFPDWIARMWNTAKAAVEQYWNENMRADPNSIMGSLGIGNPPGPGEEDRQNWNQFQEVLGLGGKKVNQAPMPYNQPPPVNPQPPRPPETKIQKSYRPIAGAPGYNPRAIQGGALTEGQRRIEMQKMLNGGGTKLTPVPIEDYRRVTTEMQRWQAMADRYKKGGQ